MPPDESVTERTVMKIGIARGSTYSLVASAALVAVLACAAYFAGAVVARRWTTPTLALLAENPSPKPELSSASPLGVDEPVEGTLELSGIDEWQFWGNTGQAATIEMWFHPGSGSSSDSELFVSLVAPDGKTLGDSRGSVFLPPYLFQASLPTSGVYRLQVVPISGSPGRYSLNLTLSEGSMGTAAAQISSSPTALPSGASSAIETLEFEWPSARRSISGWTFHDPRNPGHIGLDIAAEMWDPIVAAAEGKVVFAEWGGGYGNLVILEHAGGWSSYYAHLTEIAVHVDQQVRQGETLGGAGTTGYSTGPHLHFELRLRGRPVDPHVHLP